MTTDVNQLIAAITAELQQQADPAYRELVRTRYNMNVDHFMGVRTTEVHRIAGRYYKTIKSQDIDQRLALCRALLETRVYEHMIAAFRWAHLARKEYADRHLAVFSEWLDEFVDDWIDCDDLCIHVIGEYFLRFPERAPEAVHWTSSPNLWVRRGSAVTLVLPARRGQQLPLVFDIADRLLGDPEDLIRKAYGWLLKEASKTHPQAVFDYVVSKREVMPRVAFRYAIEKLPADLRDAAMER